MKHVHLTWYLLVDGTHADPNDVSPGKDGVLRHKNGLAVALHENGVPQSIGVDAVDNKNVEAAIAESQATDAAQEEPAPAVAPVTAIDPATGDPAPGTPAKAKQTKLAPTKKYKNREMKAR